MMVAGLGNDRNGQRGDGLKINKITASRLASRDFSLAFFISSLRIVISKVYWKH